MARSGFSLIELLVVLAIAAVIAMIASPRVGSSLDYRRAELTAHRLRNDLDHARHLAHARSGKQTVQFDRTTGAVYELVDAEDPDRPGARYQVRVPVEEWGVVFEYLDMSAGVDSVKDDLTFDMYGVPNGPALITFRVGSHRRSVRVDGDSGLVTIER